jgi:hypothetical protein
MDRLKDKAHLIMLGMGLLNFTVLPFCRLRVDNLFTLVTFPCHCQEPKPRAEALSRSEGAAWRAATKQSPPSPAIEGRRLLRRVYPVRYPRARNDRLSSLTRSHSPKHNGEFRNQRIESAGIRSILNSL